MTAQTTQPLSRIMGIINYRYVSFPASVILHSHVPFWTTLKDCEAGIGGNIRRHRETFLWFYLTGVTKHTSDNDQGLQYALTLDSINHFLCNSAHRKYSEIIRWQDYLFTFCTTFAASFNTDVTTKVHRLRRHVDNQLIDLSIYRSFFKENESLHKSFKTTCSITNHQLD